MSEPSEADGPRRRRLPRGWAAFLSELAIVVFGVFIALGAQQLVDTWRANSEVREFRAALKLELAESLGAYQSRVAQSKCVNQRLDQLERWQRDWRDGKGARIDGTIGRPFAYALSTSVWRTGATSIAVRMPLEERLYYSGIYDSLENYDALRYREVATWQALFAFDGVVQLSQPEINTLRGLILSARSTDRSMQMNLPGLLRAAARVGVRPGVDEEAAPLDLCRPLRVTSLPGR
ncbi:hypothetical protein [Glacieibacterium frigidum]|uniref:Uncharacterized protein n=1 Tax=Glacieibacterium frigidum TaxID=2593303 RepID=A0A552UHJ0_9SPHN|nr:hypothetical protein [Glacieibacterium frigidum]TRW17647.1 hypothetical protein FMM06_05730 [Glacieibacterium frigidum]